MKIGDTVRLTGVPANLPAAHPELPTHEVFEKCVGREFTVVAFNAIGWAELVIESVTGNFGQKIWVEPEFLQLISR
jgi:hypothetical protein